MRNYFKYNFSQLRYLFSCMHKTIWIHPGTHPKMQNDLNDEIDDPIELYVMKDYVPYFFLDSIVS